MQLYACFLRPNYDFDARVTIGGGAIVTRISPGTQDIPGKGGQAVMVPVTATLEGDGDTFISMHVTYGKTYITYGYSLKVSAHGQDVRIVE